MNDMQRLVEDVVALSESGYSGGANYPSTPRPKKPPTDELNDLHWRHLVHIVHKMPMGRVHEQDSATQQSLKKRGLIEKDGSGWKPTKLGANMLIQRVSSLHKFD